MWSSPPLLPPEPERLLPLSIIVALHGIDVLLVRFNKLEEDFKLAKAPIKASLEPSLHLCQCWIFTIHRSSSMNIHSTMPPWIAIDYNAKLLEDRARNYQPSVNRLDVRIFGSYIDGIFICGFRIWSRKPVKSASRKFSANQCKYSLHIRFDCAATDWGGTLSFASARYHVISSPFILTDDSAWVSILADCVPAGKPLFQWTDI